VLLAFLFELPVGVALCLYHVSEEISDEDPNRELLEKAKETTIRI
jgi:hypothetical protein